jgi:hypothetical protein
MLDSSEDIDALLAPLKTDKLIALRNAVHARLEQMRQQLKAEAEALENALGNGPQRKKKVRPATSKHDAD